MTWSRSFLHWLWEKVALVSARKRPRCTHCTSEAETTLPTRIHFIWFLPVSLFKEINAQFKLAVRIPSWDSIWTYFSHTFQCRSKFSPTFDAARDPQEKCVTWQNLIMSFSSTLTVAVCFFNSSDKQKLHMVQFDSVPLKVKAEKIRGEIETFLQNSPTHCAISACFTVQSLVRKEEWGCACFGARWLIILHKSIGIKKSLEHGKRWSMKT